MLVQSVSGVLILVTYFCQDASSSDITERPLIIGGRDSDIAEFPYQVVLLFDNHFCGGTTIDEKHIITAAHCLQGVDTSTLQIRAGSSRKDEGGILVRASKIAVHPLFNLDPNTYLDSDIAIVTLSENLEFSEKINKVALPASQLCEYATATGYGMKGPFAKPPLVLQSVELPVYGTEECKSNFNQLLTDNMICAGQYHKDTCEGDSGGPLVCNGQIIGITSYGGQCGEDGQIGIYTKVSNFVNFIEKNIA